MNYGELKTLAAAYMHRSDLDFEDFIEQAEQRIGRDVRTIENRIVTTGTATAGELALPTRFVEMRVLSQGSGSLLRILRGISPDDERAYSSGSKAMAYYISDKIYTLPATDETFTIDYYEYPESLAGQVDGTTRPLLDRYSELYLYALLQEANTYEQDFEQAAIWDQKYTEVMIRANAQAEASYSIESQTNYGFRADQPGGL